MKILILNLILILVLGFNCSSINSSKIPTIVSKNTEVIEFETPAPENPCPDQDVWVYIRHSDQWDPTCIVVVHIPKQSLNRDEQNCPADDTKVIGEGRVGPGLSKYFGMHVLTLKKGLLNNPRNYTTNPPKHIEKPANNFNMWECNLIIK